MARGRNKRRNQMDEHVAAPTDSGIKQIQADTRT